MTLFDYVVLGIVGVSVFLGLWRGVVGEVIALAAWVLAFFFAVQFGGDIGAAVFASMEDDGMRALAGFAAAFVAVLVVMALVRMAASGLVKALGLGLSDRLLGMVFGFARGMMIAMVLVAVGGMTSAPQQAWWQSASLSPPLETAVMAARPWLPLDLAKRIRFR